MNIVIAPDSFKGSLNAIKICDLIEQALYEIDDQIQCVKLPLADGGEGTLDALLYSLGGGKQIDCVVSDPLGRSIHASYGEFAPNKAFVEMAKASGLCLIEDEERDPYISNTYGTGQLIVHAMESGYREIYVGLGGSATNDGGLGLLEALGIYLLSETGTRLPGTLSSIDKAVAIDNKSQHPYLSETTFYMISDVENPLCGPNGASEVFGPQKGVAHHETAEYDRLLEKLGKLLSDFYDYPVIHAEGAGAAGGVGAAMLAALKAKRYSGINYMLQATNGVEAIAAADLVITGEGKLDAQTLSGKVINGICNIAKQHKVPVIALCGSVKITEEELSNLGLLAAFSIVREPCTLKEAIANDQQLLTWQATQILKTFLYQSKK